MLHNQLPDYLGTAHKLTKNGEKIMMMKNKLSTLVVILLLCSLVVLHFLNEPVIEPSEHNDTNDGINPVGQADVSDLSITSTAITLNESAFINEIIQIQIQVNNNGLGMAELVYVKLYLEQDGARDIISNESIINITGASSKIIQIPWQVPTSTEPGEYNIVVTLENALTGADSNPSDNIALKPIVIQSILDLDAKRFHAYPGRFLPITVNIDNTDNQQLTVTLDYHYYPENSSKDDSNLFAQKDLTIPPNSIFITSDKWELPKDMSLGRYIIWVNVSNSSTVEYIDASDGFDLRVIQQPDTSKTPVYLQTWFIVGLIALIIFFLTIIFSLIGIIPQDRLPIQPALVVMALVIMVIAFIGHYIDPEVHLIGAQDIAGMVIIHPITALTAGFLVAGGLEAAGAFAAAADALSRIEKLKFKGFTIFGFTGTVVILTNIPTLIAMPCGRILGAALMPAALFFGYRIAKSMGDARMVGVVVFPFIVNAAASCGPSPLGGIGTIGEGLSKMPIGSFTTAQSTGIMICTGVCALFMRFITFMRPADLSDEDIRREKEENDKTVAAAEGDKSEGKEEDKEVITKSKEAPPAALKKVEEGTKANQAKPPPAKVQPATAVAPSAAPAAPVAAAAPVAKKVDEK
jgi:hypothetical protein